MLLANNLTMIEISHLVKVLVCWLTHRKQKSNIILFIIVFSSFMLPDRCNYPWTIKGVSKEENEKVKKLKEEWGTNQNQSKKRQKKSTFSDFKCNLVSIHWDNLFPMFRFIFSRPLFQDKKIHSLFLIS